MKHIALLFCCVLALTFEAASQHIPICGGSAHSTSICWGYAQARSFGRSWSDSRCAAGTLYLTGIQTAFYDWYAGSGLTGVQSGDIITFTYGHAAFVTQTYPNITVDQVPGVGQPEQTGVALTTVISNYGPPLGYYRKKPLWSIKVQNNFTGGKVGVSGVERDAPYTVSGLHWESGVYAEAVMDGRLHDNYVRLFSNWSGPNFNRTDKVVFLPVTSYDFSQPITYTANFAKQYDATLQNSFLGAQGGIIKVDGLQQSAPYVAHVRQDNSVNVEATYQVINGISYSFSNWTNDRDANVVYSAQASFTPSDHTVYTAHFNAEPLAPANITLGGDEYVHITWTEHPHDSVTRYQVWRSVKPYNQNPWPPQLIATVNRGTTAYNDYDYAPINGYHPYLLGYDVRSYFAPNGTTSFPWWYHVFGIILPKTASNTPIPTSYSVKSYPNPFNPTTTIGYDLPEDVHVSLRVVDVLGREVAFLVNETKLAGSHSATWDATNVSSGLYFAQIRVQDPSGKLRFSQISKLLLMK